MAIQWYQRSDSFLRDTTPKITLRKEHIGYNAVFTKVANLNQYNRVRPGIDYENYRIYFQFLYQDKNVKGVEGNFKDTLALYSDNPNDVTKSTGAQKLYEHHALLRNISEYENQKHRQFEVKQDLEDTSIWFAQLHPTFEHIVGPTADLKGLRGIYRYKNNGLIVYIGKGVIESRINAPKRTKWVYDTIEYSVINDPEKQFEWENFWIKKYKEDNEGKLPFYNQNSGRGH
ncbi:hypothetical protein HYS96_03330 [Candidatus Daviesbacteria bacterium]|nr:hypothetical protein [Candidatus Daviesbacteria bacterium]